MFKFSSSMQDIADAIQSGNKEAVKDSIKAYEKIKGRNISGKELEKLTPKAQNSDLLSFRQNMRVLGSQTKARHLNPVNWVRAGWKEMGAQGGEGWAGGAGTAMRHIPVGAKAMTAGFAIPGASQVTQKEDPTGKGRSRTERVGELAGGLIGGVAATIPQLVTKRLTGIGGAAIPLLAGTGGFMAGEYLGAKAGKAIDEMASRRAGVAAGDSTAQKYEDMQKAKKPTTGAY
jgi:hypothetical protein